MALAFFVNFLTSPGDERVYKTRLARKFSSMVLFVKDEDERDYRTGEKESRSDC
jgi:hypothetical protein